MPSLQRRLEQKQLIEQKKRDKLRRLAEAQAAEAQAAEDSSDGNTYSIGYYKNSVIYHVY